LELSRDSVLKGRLIAVEGAQGHYVGAAARFLQRYSKDGTGISAWDASGIFYELRCGNSGASGLSPKALLLLYAADLAFRLRWDIRPALEEGRSVIAAPYVESAVAFGRAAGLPHRWLVQLFRFAIKPHVCYRIRGRSESARVEPTAGYLEFCCSTLGASSTAWNSAELIRRFGTYLDRLERRNACKTMVERPSAPLDRSPALAGGILAIPPEKIFLPSPSSLL
jgi:hypothetical protein